MSTECAICYVSDNNFLLPSMVSAAGIRRFVPPHKADIFIFTVGITDDSVQRSNRLLQSHGIRVLPLNTHVFEELDKDRLTRTHTPMAMFGRLFMQTLLPASCRRIVYLDGDTWIVRDPTALIDAVVPEGRFAAAEDTIFFRQQFGFGSTTKDIRHYFGQLGLDRRNGYFNSGVFATSVRTWEALSQEAYAYYKNNAALCEHSPDQSALNAIMGDRRLRLSSKWNFQTQLRIWGADRYVVPNICHFNRYPKPWMGICLPWPEMYDEYQNAISCFAPLNLPFKTLPAHEIATFNAATARTYSYLQWPLASWAALRCVGFEGIEKSAWM